MSDDNKLANANEELARLRSKCERLEGWFVELMTAAQDKIDFDPENQVPVCRCCDVELDAKGEGHRADCLARLTLSLYRNHEVEKRKA